MIVSSLGSVLLGGCETSSVCVYDLTMGDTTVHACSYYEEGARQISDDEGGELVAAADRGEAASVCTARGRELTAR